MLDVVYVYVPFKAKKETDRETTQCLKITEKVSYLIISMKDALAQQTV